MSLSVSMPQELITIPSPPDEADDGDAQFVKQPDGQRHDKKRKQIGGGGDDGGDDEDGHDGMTAVGLHQTGRDEAHTPQQAADDRQLEDDAHDEAHAYQRIDIRLDGQHVVHIGADLIGAQEADGEGEDKEVVDGRADDEHEIGREDNPHGVAPLVLVERRRHETEQLVEYVGRRQQQTGIEGRLHVNHELLGEPRVHEVQRKGLDTQPAIDEEVSRAGRQHHAEQRLLEQKRHHGRHAHHQQRTDDDRPQLVKMFPESSRATLWRHRQLFLHRRQCLPSSRP